MKRCAGVDGCKAGWVAVVVEDDDLGSAFATVSPTLEHLIDGYELHLCLVDMPIGLGSDGTWRKADQAARAFLKGKASSVFPTPCRPALVATSYAEANGINRAQLGVGLPKQTWAIMPKMKDVDVVARRVGQERLREGHPEVSFALAAGDPILAGKRTFKGLFRRIDVLRSLGLNAAALADPLPDERGIAADDLLDAAILAWSALRVAKNHHRSFPPYPDRDAAGLEMAIVA